MTGKSLVGLGFVTLLVGCGRSHHDDAAPAPQHRPAPEQNPALSDKIDTNLLGSWSNSRTEFGITTSVTFTFNSDGSGNYRTALNDQAVVDINFDATTSLTPNLRYLTYVVTKVTKDSQDSNYRIGDKTSCVYKMVDVSSFTTVCSQTNEPNFPATLNNDGPVFQKL